MKKNFVIIFFLLSSAVDYAQTKLNTYQYWFDEDFTGSITQAITPVNSFNLAGLIDVNLLSAGLHTFNIRFKDDSSKWSSVASTYFFRSAADIVGYEYWFDNNYAGKVTENVTSTQTLSLSRSINVDNIEPGYHSFNIRLKSSSNTWSTTKTTSFIRLGQNGSGSVISGYRYWFDQIRDTTEVKMFVSQPKSSVIINDRLNTLQLDTGFHFIYLQTKDTSGLWSSVISRRFRRIGKPRLDFITPTEGGNIGDASINIYGDGFIEGTSVKLAKGADTIFIPDSLIVNINGNRLIAIADLRGKSLGLYDLIVSVPFDTIMKLSNLFNVVVGRTEPIRVQILGSSFVRANIWTPFDFDFYNPGTNDQRSVPVWFSRLPRIEFDPDYKYLYPESQLFDWNSIDKDINLPSLFGDNIESKITGIQIDNIPPKQSVRIRVNIKSSTQEQFPIQAWASLPSYNRDEIEQKMFKCWLDTYGNAVGNLPVVGCLYGATDFVVRPWINKIYYNNYGIDGFKSLVLNAAFVIANCERNITNTLTLGLKARQMTKGIAEVFQNVNALLSLDGCYEAFYPETPPAKLLVGTVAALDPNEKYGPIAFDTTNKYITNDNPFNYVIHFENDSSATAPALLVIIKDTLNKSVFDLSTFKLGNITIGDTTISIPSGLKNYSTDIDLSGIGTSFICHLDATLDTAKGIATWRFTTLNLSNYLSATGVFDGFLPPNKKSPEGQGAVSFSIKAFDTIPLNTAVANKAYIYFDNNAPIATGTCRNKIDNVKPQSSMLPLPPFSDSLFTLRWSGNDAESGLYSYNVYYSKNGGVFNLLVSNIFSNSIEFKGQVDSTYSFYSIATDKAGNRELVKTLPESSTTIRYSSYICPGGNTFFYVSDTAAGSTYQWEVNTGSGYMSITNSGVYAGTTNDTLSLTNIPSSYYGYKYRCVITNGSTTRNSIEHYVVVKNTWNGTVNTAWENAGNWSCRLVPDENTDVIIKNTAPNQPVLNSNGFCRSLKQEIGTNVKVNENFKLVISGPPL